MFVKKVPSCLAVKSCINIVNKGWSEFYILDK